MKHLIWNHRDAFKGFARIKGVTHKIKLKPGAEPVSCAASRRSPKEEDLERTSMSFLIELGILEQFTSPCAAKNVIVPRKDHGVRVTSDFRAMNNLTVTDAYPIEEVR